MKVLDTKFKGLKVIYPDVHQDERGYFFESYQSENWRNAGIDCDFVQDNEALSSYGVIRGLHYQSHPKSQAKLVRVIMGEVLDIALDIRPESPTFGQHFSLIINDINKKQILIPKGFAHGYAVLSKTAIFSYKCSDYYAPEYEKGILHSDPLLNIEWIIPAKDRMVSKKDLEFPTWENHKVW